MQKNLSTEDRISMHATGNTLCPVRSWAHIAEELDDMHGDLEGVAVNGYTDPGGRITYGKINRTIKTTMARMLAGAVSPKR